MTTTETYKRGQVEWALWTFFLQGRQVDVDRQKVFRTRIKRLLELDRGEDLGDLSEVPHARFAFVDEAPGGKGTDTAYRPFNAFCLALALDLLDAGFIQSEIVFLLRHLRDDLEDWFERILASPPPRGRQQLLAKHRPDAPTYITDRGTHYADCRVFVVINKVEIREVFPVLEKKAAPAAPIFLRPVYCRGIDALHKELHRMGPDFRKAVVVEIANTAAAITRLLPDAPLTKRGRP